MRTSLSLALLAGAAVFALSPASAQDMSGYRDRVSYEPNNEVVQVVVPREYQKHSSITGAPIENIALSRPVRFDDLDLRTREGAIALRERVRTTAHALCRQLDAQYPITASDSPPCYQSAVRDAMEQANDAIADARANED